MSATSDWTRDHAGPYNIRGGKRRLEGDFDNGLKFPKESLSSAEERQQTTVTPVTVATLALLEPSPKTKTPVSRKKKKSPFSSKKKKTPCVTASLKKCFPQTLPNNSKKLPLPESPVIKSSPRSLKRESCAASAAAVDEAESPAASTVEAVDIVVSPSVKAQIICVGRWNTNKTPSWWVIHLELIQVMALILGLNEWDVS